MTRKLLPVAVLAALVAVLALLSDAPPDEALGPSHAPLVVPAAEVPPVSPAHAFATPEADVADLASEPGPRADGAAGQTRPAPGGTLWLARLAWPDGRPAAGVPWVLSSEWTADGAFAARGAAPPAEMRGVSDAEGRIEAPLEPLAGCWRELRVQPEQALESWWVHEERDGGRVRDLGLLVLARGARVSGRVRLEGGGRPPEGASVLALPERDEAPGQARVGGALTACDADGRFVLERVPPGRVWLEASVPGAGGTSRLSLELVDGEARDVELVAPGADPQLMRRMRLVPRGEGGLPVAGTLAAHVRLLAPGGGVRPRLERNGELVFDDLDPGEHVVELDDPAWLPLRVVARPGPEPTDLPLVGDSTLELLVVDAASGAPVETFGVRGFPLRPDQWHDTPTGPAFDVEWSPWPPWLALGSFPGGRAIVEHLSGQLHRLEVEAPGHVTTRAAWRGVPRGGRDTLVVALPPAGRVAGVVVDAAGAPQPGVRVGLFEAPFAGHSCFFLDEEEYWAFEPSQGRTCELLDEVRSDEAGRFALDLPPERRTVVRAWRSAGCDALGPVLEPGDVAHGELRLVLPAAAALRGRVALPPAVPAAGLTLLAVAREPEGVAPRLRAPLASALDTQGAFDLGLAQPGTWELWLACRTVRYLDWEPALPAWAGDYAHRVGVVQVPLAGELLVTPAPADTPGLLRVRVLVEGAPATGLQVAARDASGAGAAQGDVGEDGQVLLGPLWPGPLSLSVTDPSEGWTYEDPVPSVVPPGAEGTHVSSLVLASGVLRVLDAAGAPRAGAVLVAWRRTPQGWTWDVLRTGPDGRVVVRLPEGELRVLLARAELLPPEPDGEVGPQAAARAAMQRAMLRAQAAITGEPPAAPPAAALRVDWRRGLGELDIVP